MLDIYFLTSNSIVQDIPGEYNGCPVTLDIPTAVIMYSRYTVIPISSGSRS